MRSSGAVLILQPVIPHYRLPFFAELARHLGSLVVAAGRHNDDRTLHSVSAIPGARIEWLDNHYTRWPVNLLWQHRALEVLRDGKWDAVVAGMDLRILSNLAAFGAARKRQMPFLWWGHGFGRTRSGILDATRLRLAGASHGKLFYNPRQAELFRKRGLAPEKIYVAHNSIDTSQIQQLRDLDRPDRFRFIYVGRLIPAKKPDLLIRGFEVAAKSLPPSFRLTIIGDGPELHSLVRQAATAGIDVEFTGPLYDPEVLADYYNTAIAFVNGGYIGLSAIDSISYGVPVILARGEPHSPEVEALEEGVNAIFFESGDHVGLAHAICRLASEPPLRQQLSRGSIEVAEKFSLQGMCEVFAEAVASAMLK